MNNDIDKKKIKAVAEAPDEVKKNWSETQMFIAGVIKEVIEKLEKGSFGGDVDNGDDQRRLQTFGT